MNPKFWLIVAFLMSRIGVFQAASHCQTKGKSIGEMFLRGHTFKTCNAELPECFIRCANEVTCQSFNFVIGQKVCELNNRTKEARPEDFMPDPTRFYMKRVNNRGTIPLSAVSLFNQMLCRRDFTSECFVFSSELSTKKSRSSEDDTFLQSINILVRDTSL